MKKNPTVHCCNYADIQCTIDSNTFDLFIRSCFALQILIILIYYIIYIIIYYIIHIHLKHDRGEHHEVWRLIFDLTKILMYSDFHQTIKLGFFRVEFYLELY